MSAHIKHRKGCTDKFCRGEGCDCACHDPERISMNQACGCKVNGQIMIVRCALHESAGELLEACRALVAYSFETFKTREEGEKEALRVRRMALDAISKANPK